MSHSGTGSPTRLTDLIGRFAHALREADIPDAEKEAELIVTSSTDTSRAAIYRDNPVASEKQIEQLASLVKRRLQREPLQYILGEVEFLGLKIKVGPSVLIPRPETELLAEEACRLLKGKENASVLDLCTGSGCIALAIAKELPTGIVTGTDSSSKALAYAEENARINRIKNVSFLQGDLFNPLAEMRFDLLTANPPYIKTGDMEALQPEIRNWEPMEALDGGEDGLDFYRQILGKASVHLNAGAIILLELGVGQAPEVTEIARKTLEVREIVLIPDYAGIERIMRIVVI